MIACLLTDRKRLSSNEDWDRFLELAGEDKYTARIKEWGEKTTCTNDEIGLQSSEYFTTSIIVVEYVGYNTTKR